MKALDPHCYVLLRIVTGFMFMCHGMDKLFGWPTDGGVHGNEVLFYTAGFLEFAGGALIMVGFLTRPSAFLCAGLMAVAYWMAHGLRSGRPLPSQNGGELAVIYCFVFLVIWTRGAGKLSVDRARENAKKD